MAWCPWQNRLLATGGGTNDRSIKLWNMNHGECVDVIDTKSQVSGIFWNTEYQEIISSHGFPNHTLQIWKYPTKAKVCSVFACFLLLWQFFCLIGCRTVWPRWAYPTSGHVPWRNGCDERWSWWNSSAVELFSNWPEQKERNSWP